MLRTGALTAALLIAMVTGCSDTGTSPTGVGSSELETATSLLAPGTPAEAAADRFLHCPVSTTRSTERTIGLLGGTIRLDGHSIRIPAGAVLLPTRFMLTVPASKYVEVEIHAEGHEHFQFLLPASVTMSYDRCGDMDIDHDDLHVWYISGLTGLLLEFMGGTADPEDRHVTFSTDHLSGFIIAN